MATDYKIRVKNTSGTLVAEFTNFIDLAYQAIVNEPGILVFSVRSNHDVVQYLTDKSIVEVWRRNLSQGVDWYRDFITLFRDEKRSYVGQKKRFDATCLGIKCMLNWKIVNYSAGTTNLSTFTNKKAEYVMKQIVEYNCGPSATTGNGRKRDC